MKILYLIANDISIENSISQKVNNAKILWCEYGHTVKVVSLFSKKTKPIMKDAEILISSSNFISKLFSYPIILYKLYKIVKSFNPDIIYSRYLRYFPFLPLVLKSKGKYIIEINSNDVVETKYRSRIKYFYNIITRRFILNSASAFVCVTNELAKSKVFKKFNKRTIVIPNGINVALYSNFKRETYNEEPTFVFIGSPNQTWHGLKKSFI